MKPAKSSGQVLPDRDERREGAAKKQDAPELGELRGDRGDEVEDRADECGDDGDREVHVSASEAKRSRHRARARRVLEEALIPVQIVAPYPVTVTQRNCLELFGLSKDDYLKLVADGAFPVKVKGKLRVARFADVEADLTAGARSRPKRCRAKQAPQADAVDPVDELDSSVALRRVGFTQKP